MSGSTSGSTLDYKFYLCTPDGTQELGRMKHDTPKVDILHNFLLFTSIANSQGFLCTLLQGWKEFSPSDFKPKESRVKTYATWRRKLCKLYPNVIWDGDKDICQAFAHKDTRIDVGQWDGETGIIYTY